MHQPLKWLWFHPQWTYHKRHELSLNSPHLDQCRDGGILLLLICVIHTCAKFSEKPLFLALWYTRTCAITLLRISPTPIGLFSYLKYVKCFIAKWLYPPFLRFFQNFNRFIDFSFFYKSSKCCHLFLFVETLLVFYSLSSIALPLNIR